MPDSRDERIARGHYARKQIHCPSRVVAWSHGSRFELGRRLVAENTVGRLLDYGCGDGTFVAMVHDQFSEARGVDVDPEQIAGCRTRLGDLPGVSFGQTRDLGPADAAAWTVVTCMEVLEHCLEAERRRVIQELGRLCAAGGRIIISVPIETGPGLIAKQSFRALAGLRRLGDYAHRERYSAAEMLRAAAGARVPRVVYKGESAAGAFEYYGHKGFEWRDVEREIQARLVIERRTFSPLPWAASLLNSQVWFICHPHS
ncbi:MAG TPA: class I SAM-dependent methyltransferase [Vicinamibacterales bacterium]|nr:class I SAM-dependent methyltransferase [Vicinamibacterales bacterium]